MLIHVRSGAKPPELESGNQRSPVSGKPANGGSGAARHDAGRAQRLARGEW
jgi:hypothetical protein